VNQFDRPNLQPPSLVVQDDPVAHLLIVVGDNGGKVLPFGRTPGREADFVLSVLGSPSFGVEKLRSLEVAIFFRDVTEVVEGKCVVWIKFVRLQKV